MKYSAGGVERALLKFRLARIDQRSSVFAESFHQHAHDRTLAQLGIDIDAPDEFAAQGVEMIAMRSQGLTRQPLVEKPDQEELERAEHSLPRAQIAGLDPPAVWPVIHIQVVGLEGRLDIGCVSVASGEA